jgi:hypothetical protein
MVNCYQNSLRLAVVSVPIPLHRSLPEYPVARVGNGSVPRREVCPWYWTRSCGASCHGSVGSNWSERGSRSTTGRVVCCRSELHLLLNRSVTLLRYERLLRDKGLLLYRHVGLLNHGTLRLHGDIRLLNDGSSRPSAATPAAAIGPCRGEGPHRNEGSTRDYCCRPTDDDVILDVSLPSMVAMVME